MLCIKVITRMMMMMITIIIIRRVKIKIKCYGEYERIVKNKEERGTRVETVRG
jgi:hypothetical protein